MNILHGAAHKTLAIGLSTSQLIFVILVIGAAPLIAGVLIGWRNAPAGAVLFVLSMVTSLVFGIWNHYVVVSSDHVSHVADLPERNWANIFRITAFLLALVELAGVVVGTKLLLEARRRNL